MKKYINLIIFISICLLSSCTALKKAKKGTKKVKKAVAKEVYKKIEKEAEPVSSYYLEASAIIKKGDRKRYKKAREDLMYVLSHTSSTKVMIRLSDVYQLLALLNIKEKRYNDAIDSYKMALKKEADNINSLNGLGILYLILNKYEKAKKYFNRIIELEPTNLTAIINSGILLFKLGDPDGAINYFNTALRYNKNDHRPYYNIAEIYYNKGDYKKAKEYYKKAISVNSSAFKAKSNLSFLLLREKKYKKVIDLLETSGGFPPNLPKYYINLGIAYRFNGNLSLAEKNYLKALELDPTSKLALKNLGILYDVYMGNRKKALGYYEQYVKQKVKDKDRVSKWIKIIKGSGGKRKQ